MTSPDPTGPIDAGASRPAGRTTSRRLTQAGKDARGLKTTGSGGDVGVSREPRVTVSKAGSARRPSRSSDEEAAGDDVLDRLAQLGDEATPAPADEPVAIPVIVEADPTFPPLASVKVPAEVLERLDRDEPVAPGSSDAEPSITLGTAGTAGTVGTAAPVLAAGAATASDLAGADVAARAPDQPDGAGGGVAAVAASAVSAVSAVSEDLPTALVDASPDPAHVPGPVDVGVAIATAPAIDRTEAVPLVVPLVVPDVIPQDVPYTAPIPMAPATDQSVAIDESTGMTLPVRRLRAPMVFRRAKPRVRRVTRVVRHVDTWSVFKVALVFNVILYLVCLTSGVLLWNVAHATGTIDNIEKFFEQFGWESFEFKGGEIYHNAWTGGLFVAVGLTGFVVLLATLFNLITDLVGGIRVSVLEEEVIARPRAGRGDPTGGPTRP